MGECVVIDHEVQRNDEPGWVPSSLKTFGHYQLLRELGRGAQGVVYLAEDTVLKRQVALKMLSAAGAQSEDSRTRFHREAELASKLSHPGICGVHEFGVHEDVPFIAMQFLEGTTLAEMIETAKGGEAADEKDQTASRGAISKSLISKRELHVLLRIFEKIARALHAAHEVGLVHRDVKPANVIVTPEGDPVILDFGLARDQGDAGHTLTQSGQIMGTPAYMAAEQLRAQREKVDRRADVYALAVTLYECLTLKRPYEADTFEALYNLILQGAPANPRKHAPQLPKDLGVVVEVAMDREIGRRYQTAEEFAEDLRRVRSFEPIQAKAANTLTRTIKWTRRNPAPAVGISAVALFGLFAVGAVVKGDLDRRSEAARQVVVARDALAAGEEIEATEALARVRDRDPDSREVLELEVQLEDLRERLDGERREREAQTAAAAARQEAEALQEQYAEKRAAADRLRNSLEEARPEVQGQFAPIDARLAFAGEEDELRALEMESERLLAQAREALERAARLVAPWGESAENRTAFASFYLGRWFEATEEGDPDRAEIYRAAVERFDDRGHFASQLLGYGTLAIGMESPEASLHLFRYEPYEDLRPGRAVPRLVPVPTSGVGPCREGEWVEGFGPGDPCLVVDFVIEGTPAHEAGLTPGDLVLAIDGAPAAQSLFCVDFLDATPEVLPGRIEALNDRGIRDHSDWFLAIGPGDQADRLSLHSVGAGLEVDASSLPIATGTDLLEWGCDTAPMSLSCLRGGEPLMLELEVEEVSGLVCTQTAYPLILAAQNRLAAGSTSTLEPGSYLLHASQSGRDDLRIPFVLPRLGIVELSVELELAGSAPPGFVRIPAGKFLSGGDERAVNAQSVRVARLDDYYISRLELTNAEWDEFLADPEIAARVEESGGRRYLPREQQTGPMPRENLGGQNVPVMGITYEDLVDYLDWRNEKAELDGEPWIYDLPSELEWEKAARGADGRQFPWGSRFDFAATTGMHSRASFLHDLPGGYELRDESPYGLRDAGGHRREWTRDPYPPTPEAPPIFWLRGGSWRHDRVQDFRAASRFYIPHDYAVATAGARLIARRWE